MNFSRGEENLLELQIKAIADAGTKVIVAGAKFGDMALHYVHKYNMMAVRLNSKFDLRRLSKTVSGTVLPKLSTPSPQELGHCDLVCVEELGDTPIVAFRQKGKESRIATILIRGATDNYMDDIERAIDDGVNTFKVSYGVCKLFSNTELPISASKADTWIASRVSHVQRLLEYFRIRSF